MTDSLTELFAFALDLYRAPLRYLPYVTRRQPVPRGFEQLLEALNKREDARYWLDLSERLKASPEQLRNAGFFLVKRLLFAEGADHYRVLGLDANADIRQVRERYRLLMALFHPDRNHGGDEWTEQYAPRINEAYNILKNPRKKQVYDRGMPSVAPWGDDVPAPGSAERAATPPPRRQERAQSPTVHTGAHRGSTRRKRTRLHIGFGLLLLGLIGWFGVHLYERGALKHVRRDVVHRSVQGVAAAGVMPAKSTVAPASAVERDKGRVVKRASEVADSVQTPTPLLVRAADQGVAPAAKQAAPEECGSAGCGQPEPAETASARQTVAVLEQPIVEAKLPPLQEKSAPPPKPQQKAEQAPKPLAQAQTARHKKVIAQEQVDFLLSRFIQAYEVGDIGKFTALFGRHVRSNEGVGREHLAKRYRELFHTTRKRSVLISNVAWEQKDDGVARISFTVTVKSEDRDSKQPQEYLGDVDLLAYMDLKRLKISKFMQRAARR